ncbi:MAG: nickel pincer cofactor biosynthesis protein LarB [Acidobacteriota bacterium]
MLPEKIKKILREYKEGRIDEKKIEAYLVDLPYENLDFARVDHHRAIRHGFPEVIFGQNKTTEQIVTIARHILDKSPNVLITRTAEDVFTQLKPDYPECSFHPLSRVVSVIREKTSNGRGKIGVFSAGTADIPVAEEAALTAEIMGNEVLICYDVGVAGLHRLLSQRDALRSCTVVIVVAGMEGALPSVVGGLIDVPVIAVPTSVGYGASFNGLAALLGMLNSCSSNVTVVNIDNGFGAGYVASLINRA